MATTPLELATRICRYLVGARWLDIHQVVDEVRLSRDTIDRLRFSGLFPPPAANNGAKYVWTVAQIEDWKRRVETGELKLENWKQRLERGELQPIDWDSEAA